jgi:hypothetical protein
MLNLTKLFLLLIITISSIEIYSQQSTDTSKVLLRFSEQMSREGIFDIANYQIIDTANRQIRIYKVGIVPGDSAVVLFTENTVKDGPVKISVINLKDKSGNLISENHNIASLSPFRTQ